MLENIICGFTCTELGVIWFETDTYIYIQYIYSHMFFFAVPQPLTITSNQKLARRKQYTLNQLKFIQILPACQSLFAYLAHLTGTRVVNTLGMPKEIAHYAQSVCVLVCENHKMGKERIACYIAVLA